MQLKDGTAVQNALDLVTNLNDQILPGIVDRLAALSVEVGLNEPQSVADAKSIMQLLDDTQATLANYSVQLFEKDPSLLAKGLKAGSAGGIFFAWAYLTSASYRSARHIALGFRTRKTNPAELYSEILAAAEQFQRWTARKPNTAPEVPSEFTGHRAEFDSFCVQLETLQNTLGRHLDALSFGDLRTLVGSLASDRTTPYILPKLTSVERELDALGASPLVGELRDSKPVPEQMDRGVRFRLARFYARCRLRARPRNSWFSGPDP